MKKQEMLMDNGISTGKIQWSAGPCVCDITTVQKAWPIQVKVRGQSTSVNTV